ncbi:MAG TPA: hypothetical protein DCQ06_03680 [Myxococcales bacterium]|nr:hypothetical protein [Myxococcales bacterium]
MSDRRRGPDFDGGRPIDSARRDSFDEFDDDEEIEATRAMDVMPDDFPPPTQQSAAPAPAPPPAPADPEPHSSYDDGDDATRMLSAADFDDFQQSTAPPAPEPEPEPQITPIELRVVSGPDRGKSHDIQVGESLVGRGLDCTIVLADPAVSRKHFRVVRRDDEVEAVDMGGANGTNINGSRVSRHALQPGDQIEVGTTVLESHIGGVEPVRQQKAFPVSTSTSADVDSSEGASSERGVGLYIGLAVAGLMVLAGGGVGAWLLMGSGGDDKAKAEQGAEDADVSKFIKEAKGLIEDGEWADAIDTLSKARKIAPKNSDVKDLLNKVKEEQDYADDIEEAGKLAKKKRYSKALKLLEDIPDSSEQHDDAQDALKDVKSKWLRTLLASAREAVELGENTKAEKLLTQVLKLNPKHTEAKVLKSQVSGDDQADADSGSADKKPAPTEKPTEAASKVLKRAFKSYHNRQWSAARKAFATVAKGNYKKSERTKAAKHLSAVKIVSTAMVSAGSMSSPVKKAVSYRKAYQADKDVDGHFGPTLIKKVTESYVTAAQMQYKRRRYGKAAQLVREALNYDPENAAAMKLDDQCTTKAGELLKAAKSHLSKGNYGKARDLARQVESMLPNLDPRVGEARGVAKKAAEASVAGDDD